MNDLPRPGEDVAARAVVGDGVEGLRDGQGVRGPVGSVGAGEDDVVLSAALEPHRDELGAVPVDVKKIVARHHAGDRQVVLGPVDGLRDVGAGKERLAVGGDDVGGAVVGNRIEVDGGGHGDRTR